MTDQIRLTFGSHPWQPTAEARLVRVFDEYDIPLQGTILQDGCFYLFDCIAGRMTRPGIWIYTLIQPNQFAELDGTEGAALDELVLRVQATQPSTLAASVRGQGIVAEAFAREMPAGLHAALETLKEATQRWAEEIAQSKAELDELGSSISWDRMAATQ